MFSLFFCVHSFIVFVVCVWSAAGRDTIFDGGQIFPGGKRVGFLVFDRLPDATIDLRVIVPRVVVVDGSDQTSEIDFRFDFQQKVTVEN